MHPGPTEVRHPVNLCVASRIRMIYMIFKLSVDKGFNENCPAKNMRQSSCPPVDERCSYNAMIEYVAIRKLKD